MFAAILHAPESSGKLSRRLCTAEARGSSPLGSTLEIRCLKVNSDHCGGTWIRSKSFVQQPCSNVNRLALLRIAVVWNIPLACDRASANFMISSLLMSEEYLRYLPDTEGYVFVDLLYQRQ
jgi:methylglyoxal synthase